MIETKCLKEALVAIARVEGALDAKGFPDYTMAEAGLSTGRTKIFFKGLATLGGQVGYCLESGTKIKTFRFICAACTSASGATSGCPKNAPAQVDFNEETGAEAKPEDPAVLLAINKMAVMVQDAPWLQEALTDYLEGASSKVKSSASKKLGWTESQLGMRADQDWSGFRRDLKTLAEPSGDSAEFEGNAEDDADKDSDSS